MNRAAVCLVPALLAFCGRAQGAIIYTSQTRTASAAISFDGSSQFAAAPDFGPFVTTVTASAIFPAAGGGTGTNQATAGIDCQLDPNRIKLHGTLAGAGGVSLLASGGTQDELGDAIVVTNIGFDLDAATPISLTALERPSGNAADVFKLKLRKSGNGGGVIFSLDQNSPPQAVDFQSILGAGSYTIEYEAELTVAGDATSSPFGFELAVPAPGAGAVFACAGLIAVRRRRAR